MKKVISILILFTAFSFVFVSCKQNTDDEGNTTNQSDSGAGSGSGTGGNAGGSGGSGAGGNSNPYAPKDSIKIGETTYEYTGEVQLMTAQATITGSDDYNQNSEFPGAFPAGRTVTLSPFIMGKYEVTQEFYEAVMTGQKVQIDEEDKNLNANPSCCTSSDTDYQNMLSGEEQKYRPVEKVSWYDACYFCNALSEKMGFENAYTITVIEVSDDGHIIYATVTPVTGANGYRLPTEAEWEYAARGGAAGVTNGTFANYFSGATTTNYSSEQNADLDNAGWYVYNICSGTTSSSIPSSGTAGLGTHQVGKKPSANAAGLYDMSGNVSEWCYDWHDNNIALDDELYKVNGVVTDPSGPSAVQYYRVFRGGGWWDTADYCAVSCRAGNSPEHDEDYLGFRVVRNAQ